MRVPVQSPQPTASAPVSPTPIPMPTFAEISPASGGVVWVFVAGHRLFRSLDRGDTWEERPLPLDAVNAQISFVDDREGWLATVGSPGTQCTFQSVAISHTTNAGETWQPLPAAGIGDRQCKHVLPFVDTRRGFLAAWDPNTAPVIY